LDDEAAIAYYMGLGFALQEKVDEDSDIAGFTRTELGVRGPLRHMVYVPAEPAAPPQVYDTPAASGRPDMPVLLVNPNGSIYIMVGGKQVFIKECNDVSIEKFPTVKWGNERFYEAREGERLSDIIHEYFTRIRDDDYLAYLAVADGKLMGLALYRSFEGIYIIDVVDTFEKDPNDTLARALVERVINSCDADRSKNLRYVGVHWVQQDNRTKRVFTDAGFSDQVYPPNFTPTPGFLYYFPTYRPSTGPSARQEDRLTSQSI
jgi:hypothetical protein